MNRKERNKNDLIDVLYSINQSKKNLMSDGTLESRQYRPFIVN